MIETRILVVDDQPDVRLALKLNLQKMSDRHIVDTASDGFEALDILREAPFNLVITDYMMPGMDGLELIESVRALSPDTQIIATSALHNKTLNKLLDEAKVTHFLPKPFSSDAIRQIVKRSLAEAEADRKRQQLILPDLSSDRQAESKLSEHLRDLRSRTGAHSCLVVESAGYIIAAEGGDEQMPLASLASLVAANAVATTEISHLLGNPNSFQATIHEGEHYNAASYILEGGRILLIVFGKQVKIGLVQHYARRAAPALSASLPSQETGPAEGAFFNDDFMSSIDNSLDELFAFDEPNAVSKRDELASI